MFFSGVFSSQISFVIMFMGLIYYIAQTMIFGVDKIQHLLAHKEKENNTAQIYNHTSSLDLSVKADYHFEQYRQSGRYTSPAPLTAIAEKLSLIMAGENHTAVSYQMNIILPSSRPDAFNNRAPPVC